LYFKYFKKLYLDLYFKYILGWVLVLVLKILLKSILSITDCLSSNNLYVRRNKFVLSKRSNWQSTYSTTTRKGNHSSFRTPTEVGGRRLCPSEICAQSDPLLSINADFDRFSLMSQP